MISSKTKGIIERLDAGEVVIGDGGYVFALEKRGYLKAGPFTPECVIEFPDAGKSVPELTLRYDEVIWCQSFPPM